MRATAGSRRIISQIYHKPVTCAQNKTDVNEMHAVFVIVVLLLLAISNEPDLGTATENDSVEDEDVSSKTPTCSTTAGKVTYISRGMCDFGHLHCH